jgi:hypothetical protein
VLDLHCTLYSLYTTIPYYTHYTHSDDEDQDPNYPYRWELVTGRGWGGAGTAAVRAEPQSQLQKYREWQRAQRGELVLEGGVHYWELELRLDKVGFCGVGLARPNLRRRGPRYWRKECTDAWLLDVGFGSLFGNDSEDAKRAGSFDKGDTVGMLLDLDDGSLLFFKNGEPHGPGYPAGSVTGPVVFALHMRAARENHGGGSPMSRHKDRDRDRMNGRSFKENHRKGGGKRLYASRKEREEAEERAKQEAEEQAGREDEEARRLAEEQVRWELEEEARQQQIVLCYQSNLNKSTWPVLHHASCTTHTAYAYCTTHPAPLILHTHPAPLILHTHTAPLIPHHAYSYCTTHTAYASCTTHTAYAFCTTHTAYLYCTTHTTYYILYTAAQYKMEVALYDSTSSATAGFQQLGNEQGETGAGGAGPEGQPVARGAGWAGQARARAVFHQARHAESFVDKDAAWEALAGRVKKTKTKRRFAGKITL